MASIGYGDISPQTSTERIFGVITMISSSCMFGFIIGNIGSIIEKHSVKEKLRRETIVNLNILIKKYKLSSEIRSKSRKYLEYAFLHEQNNVLRVNDMLSNLSQPLQEEIMMHTNGSLLNHCPVFKVFSDSFIHRFARILETKIFSPLDPLIREGHAPKGMFFISSGLIEVFDNSTKCKIQSLSEGSFVGEIGLFTQKNCVASVIAAHFVDTFYLSCIEFCKIIEKHPNIKQMIEEIKISCNEGDFSALHIQCYLCKKKGHIAKNCDEIMNNERVRREWISRKENSKYVNLQTNNPLVYQRNRCRKVSRKDYSRKNVLGAKRKPREMFPNVTSLVRGIVGYIKNYRNDYQQSNGHALFTEESMISNCTMNMFRHPEWVMDSSEEELEEQIFLPRNQGFDMNLIR
jgi:hypothetical protein